MTNHTGRVYLGGHLVMTYDFVDGCPATIQERFNRAILAEALAKDIPILVAVTEGEAPITPEPAFDPETGEWTGCPLYARVIGGCDR